MKRRLPEEVCNIKRTCVERLCLKRKIEEDTKLTKRQKSEDLSLEKKYVDEQVTEAVEQFIKYYDNLIVDFFSKIEKTDWVY